MKKLLVGLLFCVSCFGQVVVGQGDVFCDVCESAPDPVIGGLDIYSQIALPIVSDKEIKKAIVWIPDGLNADKLKQIRKILGVLEDELDEGGSKSWITLEDYNDTTFCYDDVLGNVGCNQ